MAPDGKRVLVIGAGIVGLSCALHAQRRGHAVTVIDPRGFAGGASHGNAGVIAVSECVPIGTPELLRQTPALLFGANSPLTLRWAYAPRMVNWLYRFMRACTPSQVTHAMQALAALLRHARAAHDSLALHASCENAIVERGWIKAFESDATYEASLVDIDRMRSHEVDCTYLDRDALLAREPNLAPLFKHAIVHSDCAQIADPGGYTAAFGAAFLRNGGEFIRAEVESLVCRGGTVSGVRTQTETYEADVYVLAAGAWSKKLAQDAGSTIPLDTERGYHVVLSANPSELASAPILWAEHSVVMSPGPEGLRVTNSVEFAGLTRGPDFQKLRDKIPAIRRAYVKAPGHVTAQWLGFRPSMPDSIPVIGVAPKADNLVFAFGHGHLGLTLGPLTGHIVASLIDGQQTTFDLAPYSAGRF